MPPAARTFLAISAYAIEKNVSTIVAKRNAAGPPLPEPNGIVYGVL